MLGLHHVALQTPYFDETRRFYVDLIGFEVEWEPDPDNVYLTSGNDNLAIHRTADIPEVNQTIDHLGLLVGKPEDVDLWHEYLLENDVVVSAEPRTHRDGARSLYCVDPSGMQLQIIFHPPISTQI